MFENYSDIVTTKQACEMLGLSKNSVLMLLKQGTIKTLKYGRKYLIPKQSLIEYISNGIC